MASAPQPNNMPLFYNDLRPLSSLEHASWKGRSIDDLSMIANTHAIPLTVEEFIVAGRTHPIVFTTGEEPVPLALFGLNEGVNVFLDENNQPTPDCYVPAYIRRYPFMLIRLNPNSEDLSLCFDPTPGLIGEFEEGVPLFKDGALSPETQQTLDFCQQFEMGAQRSVAFIKELRDYDILTEGEVTINQPGYEQPFLYRGFQIVEEEKLKALRGDQLRKMAQSGMLPLIYAHLFSLSLFPVVFQRQLAAGKVPEAQVPIV